MAIDLGDTPVGTPPTPEQQEQIRASIGLGSTDSMTFSALTLAGQSVGGAAATNLVNLATTWNTTGNPSMIYGRVTNTNSGATANLLDIGTVAAGSLFKIDKTGDVSATGTVISTNDFKVGAAKHFHHLGRAAIGSPATGIHTLSNAALNDYDRLQFGGTTSVFPAIKRVAAGLDIKLADDSAFASLGASQLSLSDTWNTNISVTGASGTGTIATITFIAQSIVIPIGATIVVASISPAGYNGTFVVTASTLTSVSYANATTTTYVSGGTIQRLFTAIKANVTDTASNAGSKLLDLQVGGLSQLNLSKAAVLTIGAGNAKLQYTPGGSLTLSRSGDGGIIFVANPEANTVSIGSVITGVILNQSNNTRLELATSGVVEQRNGTNTQAFKLYNYYANAGVDYDRAAFNFSSGIFNIGVEKAGGGTNLGVAIKSLVGVAIHVGTLATNVWNFANTGFLLAATDNLYDIGASGANRPRSLYLSANAVFGDLTTANGALTLQAVSLPQLNLNCATATNSFNGLNITSGGSPRAGFLINMSSGEVKIGALSSSGYFPTFYSNGAESMRLNLQGQLGLGTTNPVADLDIADTWNAPAISVTGASGNGTTAVITFATQATAIPVGSTVVVAGISPAGYNGTFVVTASNLTSVSYLNATTTTYVSGGTVQQLFTSIKLNVTDTASNAGSNLLDLQVAGTSKFKVDKSGTATLPVVVAGFITLSSNTINLGNSAGSVALSGTQMQIGSSTTTSISLFNGTSTTPLLAFGGITASFPSIKRNATRLQAVLANDSGFTNIQGKLTTDTAFTLGAAAATGYITIYDSNNVAYRVWCTPA